MYESPITIKTEEIARNIIDKQEEYYILTQVQMCVDVDKDELVKALKFDREQYEKGWNDRDSQIVRCKDCRWFENDGYHTNCQIMRFCVEAKDYCSRGERREDETD